MLVVFIIVSVACIIADEWQKNDALRNWVKNIKSMEEWDMKDIKNINTKKCAVLMVLKLKEKELIWTTKKD